MKHLKTYEGYTNFGEINKSKDELSKKREEIRSKIGTIEREISKHSNLQDGFDKEGEKVDIEANNNLETLGADFENGLESKLENLKTKLNYLDKQING